MKKLPVSDAESVTATQFCLPEMDPTDLLHPDPSSSTGAAKKPVLEFDTEDGSIRIVFLLECDNAVPEYVWHGFARRWPIPVLSDAKRMSQAINAGELDALFNRILEGASSYWNGHNRVCDLSEDAQEASQAVERWLTNLPSLPETAGVWDADDWFDDDPEDLTAETTDEELYAMAEALDEGALAHHVVLTDTQKFLRKRRDRLRSRSV